MPGLASPFLPVGRCLPCQARIAANRGHHEINQKHEKNILGIFRPAHGPRQAPRHLNKPTQTHDACDFPPHLPELACQRFKLSSVNGLPESLASKLRPSDRADPVSAGFGVSNPPRMNTMNGIGAFWMATPDRVSSGEVNSGEPLLFVCFVVKSFCLVPSRALLSFR